MVSSGIAYVAKHFVFHADYDDAFEPMLFHLANQTDYKGFVRRSREEDHDFAKQHQVVYTARSEFTPKTSATAAPPSGLEGPADKIKCCRVDTGAAEQAAVGQEAGDTAGVAQAGSHNHKQVVSQTPTTLPPRSSSLPSSARKSPGKASRQLDGQLPAAPAGTVGSDTAHIYKHFDFAPDADMNRVADEVRAHLDSQPGLTSGNMMKTAVLESITGLEAVFRDAAGLAPPKVRKEAASVSLTWRRSGSLSSTRYLYSKILIIHSSTGVEEY